jgi:hypothetical protein
LPFIGWRSLRVKAFLRPNKVTNSTSRIARPANEYHLLGETADDRRLQGWARRVLLFSSAAEFPEHYEVHVTNDTKQPGPIVVSGAGKTGKTILELPAGTQGRYVIIRNTAERKDAPWAICELYLD